MWNGLTSIKAIFQRKSIQISLAILGLFCITGFLSRPHLATMSLFELGLGDVPLYFYTILGYLLLCLLSFTLFERFLYYFYPKYHRQPKYYVLAYVVSFFLLLSGTVLLDFTALGPQFNWAFFLPIPLLAIVLSYLVTPNISLLTGSICSLLLCVLFDGDFGVFLYLFFATSVTTFSVHRKYTRRDVIAAGYVVGLFNMVVILMLGCINEVTDLLWFGSNMGLGFTNGVVSSMISLAVLPYLESVFQITTSQSLLELSHLDHPLLKRLMLRAPGTYQHSLMVGNLAEAAGEAVNANPILCRVGGYFHDIGKIKRPAFFAENQFSGENPHSNLAPRMSKVIIASHTEDGGKMAKEHKLPQVLIDIILQHHGDQLVSYFYEVAKHEEGFEDSEHSKEDFRYPGPKPQSKEAGIVMLADSVEAALRAMDRPTIDKIEALVDQIFKEKIDDQQLSECPLSLSDIKCIRTVFLRQFNSVYHNRLDYQVELSSLIDNEAKDESDDGE